MAVPILVFKGNSEVWYCDCPKDQSNWVCLNLDDGLYGIFGRCDKSSHCERLILILFCQSPLSL